MTGEIPGFRLVQKHPAQPSEINTEITSQAHRYFISVYAWIIV